MAVDDPGDFEDAHRRSHSERRWRWYLVAVKVFAVLLFVGAILWSRYFS